MTGKLCRLLPRSEPEGTLRAVLEDPEGFQDQYPPRARLYIKRGGRWEVATPDTLEFEADTDPMWVLPEGKLL